MKRTLIASCIIALLISIFPVRADEPLAKPRPQIEVAFVLDTTGSMSGLIEGAKAKIWSIANQLITTEPRPTIKFALVGYRDRGDEYITKVSDLSDDIDTVFASLKTFIAGGGGDGPESVNQALHEAVNKINWSKDRGVLKIIFLVGDAPPHMDYDNDIPYADICKQAMERDLIINTVQCGADDQTRQVWQAIAKAAEGSYVAIGQTGDMTLTTTPYDDDLAKATSELNGTVLGYGKSAQQLEVKNKLESSVSAPAAVAADRAAYNAKDGGKAIQGAGDLVADVASGEVKLDSLKAEELPEAMKGLSKEEQTALIETNQAKRQVLNQRITELSQKRDAHQQAERERLAKEGKTDAFDEQVSKMVAEQAARKRGE